MMEKKDLDFWFKRIKLLLLRPAEAWDVISKEEQDKKTLFQSFFIPFCCITSFGVLLISFLRHSMLLSFCYALINLTSTVFGIYLVYLLIREYLNGKVREAGNTALNLTVYSAVIYIFFNSLSMALGSSFLSQLTGLLSLIFLRTLYTGIYTTPGLATGQKTNLFIINSLSIIFVPVIIHKLLMILFHIPAFNV